MLQQALATAKTQLQQAQQTLQSMSGGRGMERLLSGTTRNYLPADWSSVAALWSRTGGAYAPLATEVQSLAAANTVLSPNLLSALSPKDQQRLVADRERVAIDQTLFRTALANASGRFAAIQSLIDAIPSAADQKGILDLQARIGAEEGMLQNEQTKLLILSRAMQAEGEAAAQRRRESVVAAHGRFQTRFQPTP